MVFGSRLGGGVVGFGAVGVRFVEAKRLITARSKSTYFLLLPVSLPPYPPPRGTLAVQNAILLPPSSLPRASLGRVTSLSQGTLSGSPLIFGSPPSGNHWIPPRRVGPCTAVVNAGVVCVHFVDANRSID